MKKSIKYAGIAAATLLAVAPVTAPVVSNVTTVKAASTDTPVASTDTPTDADYSVAVAEFNKTFTSQTLDTLPHVADELAGIYKDGSATMNYKDFAKIGLAEVNATPSAATQTRLADAKVTVKVSNANTAADLIALQKADAGYTFTVQLSYVDSNGNTVKADPITVKYSKKGSTTTELTSANVSYTTPYNVDFGSSIYNTQLSTSSDLKVTDQAGNAVKDLTVTPDETLYTSYNAAAVASTQSSDKFAGPTFDKGGATYYQRLRVTTPTASSFGKLMTNAVNSITINGSAISAAYYANTNNTLTVIRAIKVGSAEAANWTTEDVKGVVTTKSDSAFYTLKNGSNETISNRALAKNSAWQTNAVRTNTKTGEKQYRVGADEWISANDVTFSDGNDGNGSTTGAYTDVKALNGKVTTAGPAGYYYPLYNDNGELISNRGVAGLTSWYTDKSAKNADGVTVYHVATGEWLQGTNVTYSAY
ncbi:hypothetical protein [Companilactobacillus sp. FL22-1]|uniref:hypothetical protein n=1 Tax=Companilactobacillus sp. FL22-1 TaxID=3373892 RepID=UPI0037543B4F